MVDTTAPKRIVVGVDGSDCSLAALGWAARLGVATGATIDAVTAWHYPTYMMGGVDDYRPDRDAERIVADAVALAFGSDIPFGLTQRSEQGMPARVLLGAARGAEMLIVGSRGHGGFAGLLLGSVSSQCAEHARCPVLVVHSDPEIEPTS